MADETVITYVGQLTADPELRYTANGAAVANFTIASTPRTFDRQTNDWKDGETIFLRTSAWRDLAENVAESLRKSDRVIVQGVLRSRTFDTKEGEKRTVFELDAREIGASLKWSTASLTKTTGRNKGQNQNQNQNQGENPWSNSAPAQDEPPF